MENMVYNRHYITVDADGRIIDGFSDAFRAPAESDICINEEGGYQFRLSPAGEENPFLRANDGITPIYKWENGQIVPRTEEEIEADRPDPEEKPEPAASSGESSVWEELDAAYQEGVNSV